MLTSRMIAMACWLTLVCGSVSSLNASDVTDKEGVKPVPVNAGAKAAEANLPDSEQRLADQYRELERVLMVMRDLTRQSDPNRAALIEKALKESGDRQVDGDLIKIVEMLKGDKLSTAMERQTKVDSDLQAILELLQSASASKSNKKEAERYKEYLNRVNQILREQKEQLARNVAGGDMKALSGDQGALAQKVGKLSGEIRKNEEKLADAAKSADKKPQADKKPDADKKPEGDKKPGESPDKNSGDKNTGDKGDGQGKSGDKAKPGDSDKGKGKDSNKKPDDKKPDGKSEKNEKNGDSKNGGKPSEGQPSQGQPAQGQPSQGQPSQGQPGEGQPQDQQQASQDENPARQRLDAAQQHMKDAEKNLEKAKREGSLEDQKKAIVELEKAKADLEEILRQMREEEMKRLLAMLEARFVKILQMQRDVNDNTLRLDKVAVAERSHGFDIEAGKLSAKETDILVEVDSALRLLHEEGSAVATPAAVEQIRTDMEHVMQRLARSKTDVFTQDTEKEIIIGLENVIDALKKAQKDLKDKKPPPGPSPNGQPQDPPLIEMLSELKMIRFMQERINGRTERYSKMLPQQTEQAEKDDLIEALQQLGEQQEQLYRVTRDLELGKNQ